MHNSPQFRQWLHDLQVIMGEEVDTGVAFDLYDDDYTPEEAADHLKCDC